MPDSAVTYYFPYFAVEPGFRVTVRLENRERRTGTAVRRLEKGWLIELDGADTPFVGTPRNVVGVALPDGSPLPVSEFDGRGYWD